MRTWLAAALLALAAASGAQAAPWVLQPLRAERDDALNAVSCTASVECVAVGGRSVHGRTIALAGRWTPSGWSLAPAAGRRGSQTSLDGVSCGGARACVAVGASIDRHGRQHPLAEAWNGRRWILEPVPDPAPRLGVDQLAAVSCPRANACVAVGWYGSERYNPDYTPTFSGLIERWDGRRWRIVQQLRSRTGTERTLNGVSCAQVDACLAVGSRSSVQVEGVPLAWRFDGRRWRDAHPPRVAESAGLTAVSCSTASRCLAVGPQFVSRDQNPLAEAWDGRRWRVTDPPRPAADGGAELSGVSCATDGSCIAVGGSGPADPTGGLAERFDGLTWRIEPTPGGDGWPLSAVDCRDGACEAVGVHDALPIAERRG